MKGKISLEDLVEQFLDQCRSGNVPDIQDFAGAHPEFASELLAPVSYTHLTLPTTS